jgi:hypothetical protein
LKAFDFLACLPTITTAKAEATAESNANVTPSMQVCEEEGSIKANLTAKEYFAWKRAWNLSRFRE